jgi:bacterioferritin-associated ferredoxin
MIELPASGAPRIADDTYVCRCVEITAAQVRLAIAGGAISVNDVKRRTRAGMGLCQGIFCVRAVAALIHAEAGVPLAMLAPMTARPPARVIALAALANPEE